ncbi:MAG: helix-turn-helix domain-containing protein [Dehalococcoidia bacterium]
MTIRLAAPQRRRQILETAVRVFAEVPYSRATTADLARAAGISEPALYRHFSGKKDLFLGLMDEVRERLLTIWTDISDRADSPLNALGEIGVGYLTRGHAHAGVMRVQFQALAETEDADIREALRRNFGAFVAFLSDLIDRAKAEGNLRADISTPVIAWQLMSLGLALDVINLLGFKKEIGGDRVAEWGAHIMRSLHPSAHDREEAIALRLRENHGFS